MIESNVEVLGDPGLESMAVEELYDEADGWS